MNRRGHVLNVLLLAPVLALSFKGCQGFAPANRGALEQDVLKADPSFGSVLEKHRELSSRIQTYERELELKRSDVDAQIGQLRKSLAAAAKSANTKISQTKSLMDPDRERLRLALTMAGEQLRGTQLQRSSISRSVSQLRKALKQENTALSAKERAGQAAQLDELLRDAKRLDVEILALREHVRLLKLKLLLSKL